MMKRRLAVILILCAALPATAQRSPGPTAFAQGGGAFQEENNLRPGFQTGFGFSLALGPGWQLCIEYLHWTSSSKTYGGKLYDGTLSLSPVSAAVLIEFLPNRWFIPYALAGAAYVFTSFRIGPLATAPEIRIDQKVRGGAAPYIGLGARVLLSDALSFYAEASYLRRTLPGETIVRDMNRGVSSRAIGVNVRTVFLKFGLKFHF